MARLMVGRLARRRSRGIFENSRSTLARRRRGELGLAHALDLRQHLGGRGDERRLVALAAIRNRREERRIGFDEQTIERHVAGDGAQILANS